MKRTKFTDEQIIGILAEHEAGVKCADLCRKHGMSEGTFYVITRLAPPAHSWPEWLRHVHSDVANDVSETEGACGASDLPPLNRAIHLESLFL
jgi:hypothetical protein